MPRVSAPKVAPPSDDIFVERVFELRKGRKQTKVIARFAKPVSDRRDFRCEFQIAGLLDTAIGGNAAGVDGVQALQLAMQAATIALLSSRAYQSGRLTYLGSHDLGMPLPSGSGFLTRWDLEARRVASQSRASGDGGARARREMLAERSTAPASGPADAPVLVERELELRPRRKVLVRFRQPVRNRRGFFGCAFQIEGLPGKPPSRNGMLGTDGVEALHNAMQLAMVYVLSSRAYQRGRLTWIGMYDLGLPVFEEVAPLIRRDLDAARFARELMVPPETRARERMQRLRDDPEALASYNAMLEELGRATGSKLPQVSPARVRGRAAPTRPPGRRAKGRAP